MHGVAAPERPAEASGRLLARNSVLNFSGLIVPLLVGLVAIPFAVMGLGKEGFGVLAITWIVLGYFGLFDFGLSRATTKFMAEVIGRREIERAAEIFWTALIVAFCLGLVGALVLAAATPLLAGRLLRIPPDLVPQTLTSFRIVALSVPLILCSSSLRGVLEASRRFDLVNMVMIPASMMSFVIPGLSYPFRLRLPEVVLLLVCSQAVTAAVLLSMCFRLYPTLKRRARLNVENLKRMASYGGWVSLTNVISPVLVYMDRLFIGSLISMTSVTFYSAPYEMVTRLRAFATAISTTLFPEFSSLSEAGGGGRLEMLFARGSKYVLLSVGSLVVLLFLLGDWFLDVWLGREFVQHSSGVFKVLALGVLVNSLATIAFNLLQGVGRPDLPAKFHLLELPVYAVLLWLLVSRLGILGAALAWTLRVTLDGVLLCAASIRSYPRILPSLRANRVGRALVLVLAAFALAVAVDAASVRAPAKLAVAIAGLLGGVACAWYCVVDEVERGLAVSLWQRLRFGRGAER